MRFIFRERPTLPRRLGRFSTILHEAAHQWFGDLVTMRWFDDLWLKEGFATFMAAKALADLAPDADAWKTFYLGNKPSAYAVDQTAGTRPLWQALDNLSQAKSNYGAIVYNKAPGVLKQLEYLVGDSAFQAGVRSFLARYAFGNATWRDLLASVGTAAGRPLDAFGREFMLRAGMPVVEQRVLVRDGRIASLELRQRPVGGARPAPGAAPAGDRSRPRRLWTERTELLLAYHDRPPVRLPVEDSGADYRGLRRDRPTGPRLRVRQRPRLRLLPAPARLGQRARARAWRAGAGGRRLPSGDALGCALGSGARIAPAARALRAPGAQGAAERDR